MSLNYQTSLLAYLVQSPNAKKVIPFLSEEMFDVNEHRVLLQILQAYYKKFKVFPSKGILHQYSIDEMAKVDLSRDIKEDVLQGIEMIYEPVTDFTYLESTLKDYAQDALAEEAYAAFAEKTITFEQLHSKLHKIKNFFLTDTEDSFFSEGSFLIRDIDTHTDDYIQGKPTFLEDLNSLTAARGFYSPQLIVWMSAPKSYKTGLQIKMAVEYMKDGLTVYYADAENSVRDIRNRAKQTILECTLDELHSMDMKEPLKALKMIGAGDMWVDGYPANSKSIEDVRQRLLYLKDKHNFKPDLIIYDALDHFVPSRREDKSIDNRLRYGKVYHEAIALNKEVGAFAFTPSQVNRAAVNKKIFTAQDIGEDFAKIANAHAVFAICSTPDELEMGIRRIHPVVQRQGKRTGMCVIQIDEERQIINEVDKEAYEVE